MRMRKPKTKKLTLDVEARQGAAAIFSRMRIEGYRLMSMVRKGGKATGTFSLIEPSIEEN